MITSCITAGVNVIEQDLDQGLTNFPSDSFDLVVMTDTLQSVKRPDVMLDEMLRIGRECIVTFPNFAHWRCRLYLALARPHAGRETPAAPLVRHAEHPSMYVRRLRGVVRDETAARDRTPRRRQRLRESLADEPIPESLGHHRVLSPGATAMIRRVLCVRCSRLLALPAAADQFKSFDGVDVHYIVVNTLFLQPDVAARYNVVRANDRAIVNLSVIDDKGVGNARQKSRGRRSICSARREPLQFAVIKEGDCDLLHRAIPIHRSGCAAIPRDHQRSRIARR